MEELLEKLETSKLYSREDEYRELCEFENIRECEYNNQMLYKDKQRIKRYKREGVLEIVFDEKVIKDILDIFMNIREDELEYGYKISKEITRVIMKRVNKENE